MHATIGTTVFLGKPVDTSFSMKFKATVRDAKTLAAVASTLKGFSKKVTLKLHPTRLRLISCPSTAAAASHSCQVWSSCHTAAMLVDARIESKSHDGSIYCDLPDVTPLIHALRSCERAAGGATLKLTKVGPRPVLSLSMQHAGMGHDIMHDVPVRVLAEAEVASLIVAPALERVLVQVTLPHLTDVAAFVDRVRQVGGADTLTFAVRVGTVARRKAVHELALVIHRRLARLGLLPVGSPLHFPSSSSSAVAAAGGGGESASLLSLSADGMTLSLSMGYHDVDASVTIQGVSDETAAPQGEEDLAEDDAAWLDLGRAEEAPYRLDAVRLAENRVPTSVSVAVDVKKIVRFLSVKDVTPIKVVAHVVADRALVLSAHAVGDTNLVFFIPATIS